MRRTGNEFGGPPHKRMRPTGGQSLDHIHHSMQQRHSSRQRQSVDVRKDAEAKFAGLFDAIARLHQKAKGEIEIEVRLGLLRTNGTRIEFLNGVSEEFFQKVTKTFREQGGMSCANSHETDFLYPQGGASSWSRLTLRDNKVLAMTKRRMEEPVAVTLRPKLPFDCRIQASLEQKVTDGVPETIPDGWTVRREKERMSWTTSSSHWQVELTRVTQFDRDTGETEHKLEAELELEEWVWTMLVQGGKVNVAKRQQVLEELWTGLVNMMGSLVDLLELSLEPVQDTNRLWFLRRSCWECVNRNMANRNDFPGTMPVAFSRRHFPVVQNNDYYISEKTDGVRYMLLLVPNEGAFLIGRKFAVHKLALHQPDGTRSLALSMVEHLASKGPTLIDGEVVRHATTKKLVYMVFDVLHWNGLPLADKRFSERQPRIGELVLFYRQRRDKHPEESLPFSIIGKRFFRKSELLQLRALIHNQGNERYYADADKKRHHLTDGFIFTPNDPYRPKGTDNLFKWKYIDLLSVDFRVNLRSGDNARMFTCMGKGSEEVECRQVELSEQDREIVERIMTRRRKAFPKIQDDEWLKHDRLILEVAYDPQVGLWRFHTERPDKERANHVTVLFDTMEAIAENVTVEELFYRLLRSPEQDDWQVRMNRYIAEQSNFLDP
eukprot:CAMPEP_0114625840 /NCGR_PEP_ID=MMETSP0168-20121206/11472_1 /TAXON_ID=95228 ORGANISM="Vannella sp., Strain DIVA3 517/6/12" /NCGR_SAMPLE_ID=MMETSP0168 /ASSEMBLY_ACC=CAM_ASM_000044 /LENGTH=661 /DNA_ID=CAMNT_0001837123 /DNA_START=37 /DNA_END=2018 /DNA_ORIENTATION=-